MHADIGAVHVGIRYQLHRCLCISNSLSSCLTQQQACLQSSIYRCLLFHKPIADPRAEIRPLCGVINTGKQLKAHKWHIAVPSAFGLYINFLHFYLPMSPNCKFGTRVLLRVINKDSEPTVHTYCGHRVPWYLSFLLSPVIIDCNTEHDTPAAFYFVVTFQAFDSMLPSIVLTQVNEYEGLRNVKYKYLKNNDWFPYYEKLFTFAYLSIGQERSFVEMEIHFHIIEQVYLRIKLHSSPETFSQMTIYDGPGILSPIKLSGLNTTFVYLSSYQGYIRYSGKVNGRVVTSYTHAQNHSYLNMSSLSWTCHSKYKRCYDYFNKKVPIQFTCNVAHNKIITIHQMKFSTLNMVRYSSSITSFTASCQYGGLFVMNLNGTEYLKVCTDVKKKLVIPYTSTINGDGRSDDHNFIIVIIFITFPGYSSGFIDLISGPDQDCYGTNLAISRGPSCNNYYTIWDDSGLYVWDVKNYKIKQCTDLWLINDIDYFESSPFENCDFVFNPSQLPNLVGQFEMITSAVTSVTYYESFPVNSQSATLGNMNVKMVIFEEPQINTSATKANVTTALFAANKYSFKSAISILFTTNFSFNEQFPLFTIRMKFTANIICSNPPHARGHDTSKVIRIYNSNMDTYIPRDHPFQEVMSSSGNRGYTKGTCRVLVVGQACSSLFSNYQIIRIHHSPHKTLVPRHEIDISTKKTMNCSIKCALNVGITEYIIFNNTQRSRYHEWRRIYRVTWQISAKSRGFSATINSTCETCTNLCDVAIAMGFPLRHNLATHKENEYFTYLTILGSNILTWPFWIDIFDTSTLLPLRVRYFPTYADFKNILSSITNTVHGISSQKAIYGNWFDAHAYCVSCNSSLYTLTPELSGQLKSLIDSSYREHERKYPYYFAGLHRENLVGNMLTHFSNNC